jgi:hypothetical protein
MEMRQRSWTSPGVIFAAMLVLGGGCATTPAAPLPPARSLQAGDLASLAGEWQGMATGAAGSSGFSGRQDLLRVTLGADGSYSSLIGSRTGLGKVAIDGGKLAFEGSGARGTATLHEGGGRRVLVGEGTWVGFDGTAKFELTKR